METWLQTTLTSLVAVIASSGFWAYLMRRDSAKSATTRLLMGLAYEKLMDKGGSYIDRGWLTREEYEDYQKYFYEPYKALGGNGVAERIMNGVSELPIVGQSRYAMMFRTQPNRQSEEFINHVRVVSREESPTSSE